MEHEHAGDNRDRGEDVAGGAPGDLARGDRVDRTGQDEVKDDYADWMRSVWDDPRYYAGAEY
jgi:hypothetical protein